MTRQYAFIHPRFKTLPAFAEVILGDRTMCYSLLWARVRRSSGPLLREFGSERLLLFGHVHLVAFGINEGSQRALLQPRVFRFQVEIIAVRAEKNVARQRLQDPEHPFIVSRNLWIGGVVNELVARIHVGTADDHDVVSPLCLLH